MVLLNVAGILLHLTGMIAGPVDLTASRRPGWLFHIMQSEPQNKMNHLPPTELAGERQSHEELVRCNGCSQPVAVPYAGQVTCPHCRHETRWLSRYDHAKRRSLPIAQAIVK